jgi:hypothetical protein
MAGLADQEVARSGVLVFFTNMEDDLKAILATRQVPADLSITYDDMHGLWGGSTLMVRGDGRLERQVRPRGAQAPGSSKKQIGKHELLDLVRLLVDLSAWEQRTPDNPPVPDENRSYLTISLKGKTSLVWERYNDMPANERLIRIKRWIETQFEDFGDSPRIVPSA